MAPASSEVTVGIAGLGYWGPNLVRNFRLLDGCRVTAVADPDPNRVAGLRRLYPDLRPYPSAEDLIDDPAIDAVVLALPASLLPDLSIRALNEGKHVLIEKPMANRLEDALGMEAVAAVNSLVAMVDFTFVYSPAVRFLRSIVQSGEFGAPHYYQSSRMNLGRFRTDIDVVWDLVVHDISILMHVLERSPSTVLAIGRGRSNSVADTAHVTLTYEDGFRAFIHASWLAPVKVRQALFACQRGMIAYDDVHPDEKIRVYQVEEQFDPENEESVIPTFRLGDVLIPRLSPEEPLRTMASTFVDAIKDGAPTPTDWLFGTRVLSVLDAAHRSLEHGEPASVLERVPAA